MVATVRCDKRNASGMSSRSLPMSVIMAASRAMSLPFAMAKLRSAVARAALSLIPSPATATRLPACCSAFTTAVLSFGRRSARHCAIPASRAVRSAAAEWSPVSIITSIPSARNRCTATGAEGFSSSAIPATATTCCAAAKRTMLLPAAERRFISSRTDGGMVTLFRFINASLPMKKRNPCTDAAIPKPSNASKSAMFGSFSILKKATTALANG